MLLLSEIAQFLDLSLSVCENRSKTVRFGKVGLVNGWEIVGEIPLNSNVYELDSILRTVAEWFNAIRQCGHILLRSQRGITISQQIENLQSAFCAT